MAPDATKLSSQHGQTPLQHPRNCENPDQRRLRRSFAKSHFSESRESPGGILAKLQRPRSQLGPEKAGGRLARVFGVYLHTFIKPNLVTCQSHEPRPQGGPRLSG